MITFGGIRSDLSNLSNRVMVYPVMYLIGFAGYWFGFGNLPTNQINTALPLLALNVIAFAHIASEKIDKVSDRITLELGGRRRRLLTRMFTVAFWNILLVGSFESMIIKSGHYSNVEINTVAASAAVVILVNSTIGVLIADLLPHPLFAMVATFAIVASTGVSRNSNLLTDNILGMIESRTILSWLMHVLSYCAIWFCGFVILRLVFNKLPSIPKRKKPFTRGTVLPPKWIVGKISWWRVALRATVTDALPLVSLLVVLLMYCYGTVKIAADLSTFASSAQLFGPLPSLLFMDTVPAILLASIWLKQDVADQESLLYKSQSHALLARIFQYSIIIAMVHVLVILILCLLLGVSPISTIALKAILAALVVAPALAAIGAWLVKTLKQPLFLGVLSYALTLPEVLTAKWLPGTAHLLPTSMYSGLLGSIGPFNLSGQVAPPGYLALFLVLLYVPLVLTCVRLIRRSHYFSPLTRATACQ